MPTLLKKVGSHPLPRYPQRGKLVESRDEAVRAPPVNLIFIIHSINAIQYTRCIQTKGHTGHCLLPAEPG